MSKKQLSHLAPALHGLPKKVISLNLKFPYHEKKIGTTIPFPEGIENTPFNRTFFVHTPARTLSISGIKSRVLKLPFLT